MTATELQKNIDRILDSVVETGREVVIERKGKRFIIMCTDRPGRIERLKGKKRTQAYIGDSDELVSMDWSSEWHPGPT